MNTIDIYDGMVRNQKWEAKRQAQLDAIYDNEYRKHSTSCSSSSSGNTYDPYTIKNICSRLDMMENRLNYLEDKVKKYEDSSKLFVFTPNSTVNANVAFPLNDDQFKMLIDRLEK